MLPAVLGSQMSRCDHETTIFNAVYTGKVSLDRMSILQNGCASTAVHPFYCLQTKQSAGQHQAPQVHPDIQPTHYICRVPVSLCDDK